MTPHQSLANSAEVFRQAGEFERASFCAMMARDALAMATHFPEGGNLYRHWAGQMAEAAEKITEGSGVAKQAPPAARPEPQEWR